MFERKRPVPQKRIDSLIGAETRVRGDIVFSGGLRIDGQVDGNVATLDGKSGTLVVSERARISGKVEVSHVVVNGTVEGPITAKDYLELQGKARVVGDLAYKTLEMHLGAVVAGRLQHFEPESAEVVEFKRSGAEQ